MQPVFTVRLRLGLYAAICISAGGLLSAAMAGHSGLRLVQAAAVVLPLAVVYGFICLSSSYVCRATPLRTSALSTVATNLVGSTLVAGALWLVLARALAFGMAHVPGLAGTDRFFAGQSVLLFVVGAVVYLLTIAAHYVVLAMDDARVTEQRALEAQLAARDAQLKALRAQVEPHFLFNSLNSISALTGADPAGARRMCLLLAEFLRASLDLGARDRIPLADELALVRRFLEIEQVRFGARLSIEQSAAPDTAACLVPPLLLQPLAENAVNHGIAGLLEGGVVRIDASRVDGELHIAVENPVDRDRPRRARVGVGLDNVRRRLATQYGGLARVEVDEREERFRVAIALPATEEAERTA